MSILTVERLKYSRDLNITFKDITLGAFRLSQSIYCTCNLLYSGSLITKSCCIPIVGEFKDFRIQKIFRYSEQIHFNVSDKQGIISFSWILAGWTNFSIFYCTYKSATFVLHNDKLDQVCRILAGWVLLTVFFQAEYCLLYYGRESILCGRYAGIMFAVL